MLASAILYTTLLWCCFVGLVGYQSSIEQHVFFNRWYRRVLLYVLIFYVTLHTVLMYNALIHYIIQKI